MLCYSVLVQSLKLMRLELFIDFYICSHKADKPIYGFRHLMVYKRSTYTYFPSHCSFIPLGESAIICILCFIKLSNKYNSVPSKASFVHFVWAKTKSLNAKTNCQCLKCLYVCYTFGVSLVISLYSNNTSDILLQAFSVYSR